MDIASGLEATPGHPGGSAEDKSHDGIDDLAARVSKISWYHSIELPAGVVTPGAYDHRPLVPHYGIPEDLSGKRVLDIASFDGFWTFEFERRGAEVVAVDLARWSDADQPAGLRDYMLRTGSDAETGAGFRLAAGALQSKAERVTSHVYDINPETLGTFDLVHAGDLLLHVRDPLLALQRIRSVTRTSALIVDCFNRELDPPPGRHLAEYRGGWPWRYYVYWLPSLDTLAQMVVDAGFSEVVVHNIYRLDSRDVEGPWRAILIARP